MSIEKVSCFPNEGTPQIISGVPQTGDIIRVIGTGTYYRYTSPSVVVPKPVVMSDKQFRKYAAQKLGSAAAVGLIDRAAETSADGDVRFAFRAWAKAQTFEKAEVEALTAVLATGGVMTTQQRDNLIGANWPEA